MKKFLVNWPCKLIRWRGNKNLKKFLLIDKIFGRNFWNTKLIKTFKFYKSFWRFSSLALSITSFFSLPFKINFTIDEKLFQARIINVFSINNKWCQKRVFIGYATYFEYMSSRQVDLDFEITRQRAKKKYKLFPKRNECGENFYFHAFSLSNNKNRK